MLPDLPQPPRLPISPGITNPEPVPAEIVLAPGVVFNAPPLDVFPQVMQKIDAAVESLPEGKRGGLISVFEVTPDGVTRVNAAVVHRVDTEGRVQSDVSAWIGKEWGGAKPGISYGVAWRTTW